MAEWVQKFAGVRERTVGGELWRLQWLPACRHEDAGWYLYGPSCPDGDWMGPLYNRSEANADESIAAWQAAQDDKVIVDWDASDNDPDAIGFDDLAGGGSDA